MSSGGRHCLRCFRTILLLSMLFAGQCLSVRAQERSGEFTIAAVQFAVDEDTYLLPGAFEARVRAIVAEAALHHDADLLVFPEYINVFAVASEFAPEIREASTLEEAAARLIARHPDIHSLADLFETRGADVSQKALSLWKRLADEFDITIVPGTFFVPTESEKPKVRNRLMVIDGRGRVLYYQDKVFLTEEEKQFGLDAGAITAAEVVTLGGLEVALTICRDSYFSAWEERLGDSDIWIDLRANGQRYSPDVRRRFDGALPERVERTAARAGVSATLTGEFLDLVFEGPAFAVDATGRRVAESPEPRGTSLVLLTYDGRSATLAVEVDPRVGPP